MIVLLSPAKTMDFAKPSPSGVPGTKPRFHSDANRTAEVLKGYSTAQIGKLMATNAKIASQTQDSFAKWKKSFNAKGTKQAVLAYQGDVYRGLKADELKAADLKFAQKHLRILTGLYGVLRPLDLIQPYRLEMKTKLKTSGGRDLYELWKTKLTDSLFDDLKSCGERTVLNLASNEYFKAIDPNQLEARIVTANFKEEKDGKFRFLTVFGKQARGLMARFVIENRITKADDLKSFKAEGYRLNKSLSKGDDLIYTRNQT